MLNLRGDDIPFNPVFHAYLFVSLESTILFVEQVKIPPEIETYLQSIGVQHREYNDLWSFLRKKEWGEGKVSPAFLPGRDLAYKHHTGYHHATDVLRNLPHAHKLSLHYYVISD